VFHRQKQTPSGINRTLSSVSVRPIQDKVSLLTLRIDT